MSTHTYEDVPLDKLTIDARVQRATQQVRVDEMVKKFNPDGLGMITVSRREDGSLIILDGGHRVFAALKHGSVHYIYAKVYGGLSLQQEAELFLLLNTSRTPEAISKFKAGVVAEHPGEVEINQILNDAGWTVSQSGKPGNINAIIAAERVYRSGSGVLKKGSYPELLRWTVTLLTEAWGHDSATMQSGLIQGVGQLGARHLERVDREKLLREMQRTTPRRLIGEARALKDFRHSTLPAAVAEQLVNLHNARRKGRRLPDWRWSR